MPQTYIRAVGPCAATWSAPLEVSHRRRASPRPGSSGRSTVVQACTHGAYVSESRDSERGPRHRWPLAPRVRIDAVAQEPADAEARTGDLPPRDQRSQRLAEGTARRCVEPRFEAGEDVHRFVAQRLAAPAPQDRPQLVLAAEGHSVVHTLYAAVGPRKEMAALAVRVVHDGVQHDHPPQVRVLRADEQPQVHSLVD